MPGCASAVARQTRPASRAARHGRGRAALRYTGSDPDEQACNRRAVPSISLEALHLCRDGVTPGTVAVSFQLR